MLARRSTTTSTFTILNHLTIKNNPPPQPPQQPQPPQRQQASRQIEMPKRKVYRCKLCEHETTEREGKWQHIKTHVTPDKLLACNTCPFVTEYKHHLEYHQRNHSGYKPFQCDQCDYKCVNKSMLKSHSKSHSTLCPFRCGECRYATKYAHSLKMHLKKYQHKRPGLPEARPTLPSRTAKNQSDGSPDSTVSCKKENDKPDIFQDRTADHIHHQQQQQHQITPDNGCKNEATLHHLPSEPVPILQRTATTTTLCTTSTLEPTKLAVLTTFSEVPNMRLERVPARTEPETQHQQLDILDLRIHSKHQIKKEQSVS